MPFNLFNKKRPVGTEYPESLQIETTNRCNAKCTFCHHPSMKRPLTDMTDNIFEKIIKDAKEIRPKSILPFLHGEMFLDKKIFDRMAYINEELPETRLDLFTNVSLLDSGKREALSKIRNINILHCSLNSYDAGDYKERVGLNFETTFDDIKSLARLNKERKFAREILVSSVEFGKENKVKNKEYNDRFTRLITENIPGVTVKVVYKYNYMGKIFSFRKFRDMVCCRLKTLCVLAEGLVSLCCMDMDGEYILGDANETSLLDIYNGDLARKYRSGRKSKFVPCRHCNMI